MLISIFSDASFCQQSRAAGWGGWAKSERGTTRGGGPLHNIVGVNEAEAAAIIETVKLSVMPWQEMLGKGPIPDSGAVTLPGDHLLVQSDSQSALRMLFSMQSKSFFREEFNRVLREYRLTARWRWVKGHHPGWKDSPRHAVNRSCDITAGRYMREERVRKGMK
jgi:hypothetical protein